MKYIKLFEAFESQAITNTIKFLTKEVGQNSATNFLNDIKDLMDKYDIPISKIKEDDLQYTRTSKAIKIKNKQPVDNNWDIYCIKYWFSLKDGFLGKTATGNLTTPYIKITEDNSYKNRDFDENQLEYINNELNVKTGKLTSVLDYTNLKTGDDVFVILGEDANITRVTIGKICVDHTDGYYSIFVYNNDKSDGVSIYNKPDFVDEYSDSWRLARVNTNNNNNNNNNHIDGDHFRLHFYTKDSKKLRQETKIIKPKHKANLADFNKPLYRDYMTDWTLGNQYMIKNVIEESDFAIVVYMDKLLLKPNIYTTKAYRREARKGATALMSDYDIKKLNINNYTTKLVAKYGLHKDAEDFSKLNKLVNSIMCNKYIMFNLYLESTIGGLNNLINQLYNLINENDKDNYFDNILHVFKNNRERTANATDVYRKSLDIVLDSGNENLITIIKRFLNLGEKVNKYIENTDVENIHDLIMIRYKLKAIEGFISDSKNKLSTPYNDVIYSFYSSGSMKRYVNYCEDLDEEDFTESMNKLDIIEKFVNSILK